MDPAQALADLTEISSQIQAAVLFDREGKVLGSTLADEARAEELVAAVVELLAAATEEGSVFVVGDGERRIVATTGPEPTVGLVFYDLKSCLRGVAEEPPKPRRRTRRKKTEEDGDAT